jgi:hypothetical protein
MTVASELNLLNTLRAKLKEIATLFIKLDPSKISHFLRGGSTSVLLFDNENVMLFSNAEIVMISDGLIANLLEDEAIRVPNIGIVKTLSAVRDSDGN